MLNLIPVQYRAAILVVALTASWWAGWEWRNRSAALEITHLRLDYTEAAKQAAEEAQAKTDAIANAAAEAERHAADMAALREEKNRVITKEVIRYVSAPDTGRQPTDNRWLCLHDRAATGLPGDDTASCNPDAESGRITDRDTLVAVTENYRQCLQWRAELIQWQGWWKAVSKSRR